MAFAGMEWIIVIIVVVLLLFGAKKIPELARSMGKARAEFSRGQQMVEKELREAQREDKRVEAKEDLEDAKRMKSEKKALEDDGADTASLSTQLDGLYSKGAMWGGINHLIYIGLLVVMIWKPGS